LSRLLDERDVLLHHRLADVPHGLGFVVDGIGALNQPALHDVAHGQLLRCWRTLKTVAPEETACNSFVRRRKDISSQCRRTILRPRWVAMGRIVTTDHP